MSDYIAWKNNKMSSDEGVVDSNRQERDEQQGTGKVILNNDLPSIFTVVLRQSSLLNFDTKKKKKVK